MKLWVRGAFMRQYTRRPASACWALVFLILATGRACDAATPWADQYHPQENLAVPGFSISQVTGFMPGQQAATWRVEEISSSEPANVFYRGQPCRMTFQFTNQTNKALAVRAMLEVVHYKFLQPRSHEFRVVAHNLGIVGCVPMNVSLAPHGFENITVAAPLPETFGGYRLVAVFPGFGQRMAADVVRVRRPDWVSTEFPVQTLDVTSPAFLQRIGVHAVRMFVSYHPTTSSGFNQWMAHEGIVLRTFWKHHITIMLGADTGGPQPLGQWRHRLNSKNQMVGGYNGTTWLPSSDPDFTRFVRLLTVKYGYPHGPITAWCLYNEPWQGGGISGWLGDIPRYRQAYRAMAAGVLQARKLAHVRVLVGGTDSSQNAIDNLFCGGRNRFLPIFNYCSEHYQGLNSHSTLAMWRDRRGAYGPVRIWDTESWICNAANLMPAILGSWRAAGYGRVMGIMEVHCSYLVYSHARTADGSVHPIMTTEALDSAAGVAALAHFMGDRPFKKILFRNGLPWVFVFGGVKDKSGRSNPYGGTVIVTGKLEDKSALYRAVKIHHDARMLIAANPAYALFDCYGNRIPAVRNRLVVPLNTSGYYLRGNGKPESFDKLLAAIKTARIQGIDPVQIIAHDMTYPLSEHPYLRLSITDVLNRPITGVLHVKLGHLRMGEPTRNLRIGPNQTLQVNVPVTGGAAVPSNTYFLRAVFNAGKSGSVTHLEAMHCNVIARRHMVINGNLAAWRGALPQPMTVGADRMTLKQRAWLGWTGVGKAMAVPASGRSTLIALMRKMPASVWDVTKPFPTTVKPGFAVGYLAYGKKYFYFLGKVADDTPCAGTLRWPLSKKVTNSFFFPNKVYAPRRNAQGKIIGWTTLIWPKGVPHYTYRRGPVLPCGCGNRASQTDNIQLAFNVVPPDDVKLTGYYPYPPGTMPQYTSFADTNYEFALNQVAAKYGGGTQIWRLLRPGMPMINFFPRQPAQRYEKNGSVQHGKLIIKRIADTRIFECAIPWSRIPLVKQRLDAGKTIKFTFRVNLSDGMGFELSRNRSVSKPNDMTFHPGWLRHWSNELRFGFQR